MNDRRSGAHLEQPAGGSLTDPSAAPVTGPLDAAAPPAFPIPNASLGSHPVDVPTPGKPIVVTRPMAAHPPAPRPLAAAAIDASVGPNRGAGRGAVVTHRATQMSASVGVPSTLESPKDPMLLRAEAQTRIERPLGAGAPSSLDDVDSTMPDNAARDAAIRDAARAADERAGARSDTASKQFGPPTLQSPNDGALPSSPAASIGGAVVDAVLPSAAFLRPEPPPAAPTRVGPPPLPIGGGQPFGPTNTAGLAGVGRGGPTRLHGPAMAGASSPDAWAAAAPHAAPAGLTGTGVHAAGAAARYSPGAGGVAMGSAMPGPYLASSAPPPASLPAGLPRKGSGAIFLLAALAVVAVVAFLSFGFYLRARGGQLPLGTTPSGSVAPPSGPKGK